MGKNAVNFIFAAFLFKLSSRHILKFNSTHILYLLIGITSCALLLPGYFNTTMFLWDESRQANNALEMSISNNFLYPTFNFEPEFWNTKPHLLIVLQALFIKIFGPTLFALRLPSFLATIALILSCFYFTRLHFPQKKWIAFLWPFVIPLSGYNTYHLARTADYDAMLTLFVVLAVWCYLSWFKLKTPHFAKLTVLFLTLAWFVKSFAVLLWIPGIFIHLSLTKNLTGFFSRKNILFSLTCLGAVIFYCTYREILTPGYLKAIWANEGGGRYNEIIESHTGKWYYYLNQLYAYYLPVIFEIFILLFLINCGFFRNSISFVSGLFSILFLVFISFAKTCLPWYAGPAIPLILVSVISFDYRILLRNKFVGLLFLLVSASYLCLSFERIKDSQMGGKWKAEKLYTDSYIYLKTAYQTRLFDKGQKNIWVNPGSGQHEAWFDKLYKRQNRTWNWHIQTDSLKKGDTVWFTYHPLYREIADKYNVNFIDSPTGNFFAWKCVVVTRKDSATVKLH